MEQINGTPGVGEKLRRVRKKRKITLANMAEELGMSYSYLSKLENDKCSISVGNLQKICAYLDVDMVYFFSSPAPDEKIDVIKQGSAIQYETQDGLKFRVLTAGLSENLEVSRIYHPPHGPAERRTYRHKNGGEEFITVVSGKLFVEVAGRKHCLSAGDSILFDAKLDHSIYTEEDDADFYLMSSPPYGNGNLL